MFSNLVDGWPKVECYSFVAQKGVCSKPTRFHSSCDDKQCPQEDFLVHFGCSFQIRSLKDYHACLTLLCLYFQKAFLFRVQAH